MLTEQRQRVPGAAGQLSDRAVGGERLHEGRLRGHVHPRPLPQLVGLVPAPGVHVTGAGQRWRGAAERGSMVTVTGSTRDQRVTAAVGVHCR